MRGIFRFFEFKLRLMASCCAWQAEVEYEVATLYGLTRSEVRFYLTEAGNDLSVCVSTGDGWLSLLLGSLTVEQDC